MNKTMTLNIILIIAVLILVGLLGWFLIINRADDRFNQIFSKILIALVAAIVLIGFELLIKPKPVESKVKVLTLRNKDYTNIREFSNRLHKINSEYKNGYSLMSNTEIFNANEIKKLGDNYNSDQIGLDNLEFSFWAWLGNKYMIHWDIEQDYFEGISGGGGNTSAAENADKETMILKYSDLKTMLISNQFIPEGHGQFFEIHFPKSTKIKVIEDTKNRRSYKISNKYYNLIIEMYSIGNSGLTYTTLGENIKEALKATNTDWYSDRLIIKMKCDFSSFYKGSPHLIKQKQWIIDIMDGIAHDFDWDNIKPELERAYNQ
jgi:hypothetical protein